jgi:hypothetical protein
MPYWVADSFRSGISSGSPSTIISDQSKKFKLRHYPAGGVHRHDAALWNDQHHLCDISCSAERGSLRQPVASISDGGKLDASNGANEAFTLDNDDSVPGRAGFFHHQHIDGVWLHRSQASPLINGDFVMTGLLAALLLSLLTAPAFAQTNAATPNQKLGTTRFGQPG